MFELLEPYVSCQERNFGNMVLSNKKALSFPLPEKKYNDLYQFYCDFFSENLQRFCLLNIDSMKYYNEMYILFLSSLDFLAEGEPLTNYSFTQFDSEFIQKVKRFNDKLINKYNVILAWKADCFTGEDAPKELILGLIELIGKYFNEKSCELIDKCSYMSRLPDEESEVAEHEDEKLLEEAPETKSTVTIVGEKETVAAVTQHVSIVSEETEVKQATPIKEIPMDSSSQASSDKSLAITEKK